MQTAKKILRLQRNNEGRLGLTEKYPQCWTGNLNIVLIPNLGKRIYGKTNPRKALPFGDDPLQNFKWNPKQMPEKRCHLATICYRTRPYGSRFRTSPWETPREERDSQRKTSRPQPRREAARPEEARGPASLRRGRGVSGQLTPPRVPAAGTSRAPPRRPTSGSAAAA